MTREEFLNNLPDALILHGDGVKEFVERVLAVADQNPKWIPVAEGLPKENGRYWCCDDDGGQEELKWYNGSWYGLLDAYPIEGITHWMELPAIPGNEK